MENPDLTPETLWLISVLSGAAAAWPFQAGPAAIRRVLEAARRERIVPLCFHHLAGRTCLSCPRELLDRLRALAKRESALDLHREIELQRVLEPLRKADLHPLVIKGTGLAYTVYSSPHLRSRCDTDLLFRDRRSADTAWAVLEREGYRRMHAVRGDFIQQAFPCTRTDGLGTVHALDLHWHPSNEWIFHGKLTFEEVERRAQPIPVLGPNARTPHPVQALLLACMHRMQHAAEARSRRLLWLYDIRLLALALSEADTQEFLRLAAAKGLGSICLDGLRAAEQTFAGSVPGKLLDLLEERSVGDRITAACFADSRTAWLGRFRALPGWRSRFAWIREQVFPDTRYMLEKYRTDRLWLLPWFYLHRLLNRLLRHLK